jgi:hypothetical protein
MISNRKHGWNQIAGGGGVAGTSPNSLALTFLYGAVLLGSVLLPIPAGDGRILGLPSICLFYDLTGLPCPGCGLTRSFVCFAHGQIAQAYRWNLLGPELWLICALFFMRALLSVVQKRQVAPFSPVVERRASIAAFVVFVVFGVSRIVWLTVMHRHFSG